MSGEIIINDLRVQAVIGVHEHERTRVQNLVIRLRIFTDFSRVSISDNIADTVNYSTVAKDVEILVRSLEARTLEHLAGAIAHSILTDERIERVIVKVKKAAAIGLAKDAGVRIGIDQRSDAQRQKRAFIGLGSNLGNRASNITAAISMLSKSFKVAGVSFLYETEPQYLVAQPRFLNAACEIICEMDPVDLLFLLKSIEGEMGRIPSSRWGPRSIDLDIIFFGDRIVRTSVLTIPHPQMTERDFVLGPMADLDPDFVHPIFRKSVCELLKTIKSSLKRVVPLRMGRGEELLLGTGKLDPTMVMAIVNVTPDSFSDGSKFFETGNAIIRVEDFVEAAKKKGRLSSLIIDIGGESTRPNAEPVEEREELNRVLPVIRAIRQHSRLDVAQVVLSIDTCKVEVARAALDEGVDIINTVAENPQELVRIAVERRVPIVLTHTRGDPKTMKERANYDDPSGIIHAVASEMIDKVSHAISCGALRFQIITDPGFGFAKAGEQSLELLRGLSQWKSLVCEYPLLVGLSRKGFLGNLTNTAIPEERDYATAAMVAISISAGANIVRIHNVKDMIDAVLVSDAVFKTAKTSPA